MSAQKMKYIVPRNETTTIRVGFDTRMALKVYAKSQGITMVYAAFLVIRSELASLIAKEEKKDQDLLGKVMGLYRSSLERERSSKKNLGEGIH